MKQKLRRATRIFIGSVIWTLVLAGVLLLADRGIFGPIRKSGWLVAASLSDVPTAVGRVKPPAYLPQPLLWPPSRIFYRVDPTPGWWVEVAPSTSAAAAGPAHASVPATVSAPTPRPAEPLNSGPAQNPTRVWFGSGAAPGPNELGELQECLARDGHCPDGWRLFTTHIKDARPGQSDVIYMITNIDPMQASRILEGLRL